MHTSAIFEALPFFLFHADFFFARQLVRPDCNTGGHQQNKLCSVQIQTFSYKMMKLL